MSDLELEFISGRMFDIHEIPKEKKYLYRYFRTEEQRIFVRYFLALGSHTQFVDHTGIRFKRRWRQYLARRLRCIMAEHDRAKSTGDLVTLSMIESGQMKVPSK